MIYNNAIFSSIIDLKDEFDIFIFDAYGVLYDGSRLYSGVTEAMEDLIKAKKIVCIASNVTNLTPETEESYKKRGLKKDEHYHLMVTSGEVARRALEAGKIEELMSKIEKKEQQKRPIKVFQFGKPNKKLFNGLERYEIADNLDHADIIYISVPLFTEAEYNSFSEEEKQYLFESNIPKEGEPRGWDTTNIQLFDRKISELLASGLPILNANPDLVTPEAVKGNQNNKHFVIRQGYIAQRLREEGAHVIEIGKPDVMIYDFIFETLKKDLGANISEKSRIAMIGDTLRTDIQGALNAGIVPVLCVKTGNTYSQVIEIFGREPETQEELRNAVEDAISHSGIQQAQIFCIEQVATRQAATKRIASDGI
jgi:HAD superfamily hydrolase (TIGR01450 family)